MTHGVVALAQCPSCGAKTLPEDIHVKTVDPMTFYYQCETCGESYDLGEMQDVAEVTIRIHRDE